jgi:hypothetical protein
MATFDYSGTYMTSWLQPDGTTYLPGPVVVDVSTGSVNVNGVPIQSPLFDTSKNNVSWNASAGNSSSASFNFYQNAGVNGFVGLYARGGDPLRVIIFSVRQVPRLKLCQLGTVRVTYFSIPELSRSVQWS